MGGTPKTALPSQDRAASLRRNSSKYVSKYTLVSGIILPISRFSRFPIPDSRFPIPDSRPKCKKPTPVRSPHLPISLSPYPSNLLSLNLTGYQNSITEN
ncbi:hypothetical protein [Moorena bouillonii]|uniref:hypothetical protein n=1 Tax=Moorena bouillonii TaxID=207920 RepID=UPI00117DF990|nr:hypothetical protein [Moorena bouillonii]